MRDFAITVLVGVLFLIVVFAANHVGAAKVQNYLDAIEQAE